MTGIKVRGFKTPLQDGWGATTDDKSLIVTDSGAVLYWLNPDTFEIEKLVNVNDAGQPVKWVNELEWINDEVWANIWQTDCIARINPDNGQITGWVLLHELTTSLRSRRLSPVPMDVLNGIAWDDKNQRLFVTGKQWPRLFEISLIQQPQQSEESMMRIRRSCIPP